ncbi:hypothetical protein QFC19_007733 [Naganishia cerealis]|uniref:Uncharacterized protein n=1 Tax=Naganishia cerealis TaxID=610337 RepID=A0ACC2V7D8_9TREE|nr:hypothetical protein QFC19_007733 [Naganishia cerealis]
MDGHNAYGSISSRLDPMLLPSIDSFDQQQSRTTTHTQQHSNGGAQLSSTTGGSLQLPALQGDTNGTMMNDTSSYLHDMDAVVRLDTLPDHQLQDPSPNRYLPYNPFPSHGHDHQRASTSKSAFTPEEMGLSRILSTGQDEPSPARDRRENDYFIHSQDHRKKFLGASSSQVFVKWLDEESGGMNPSSHLKHGMTSAEEMILPGQLELCNHPLPPQPELETYISTYFRTFHILYPVLDESWLRSQLSRPKGPQTAGEDVASPVVYLVVSLGASMTANSLQSSTVSKTYLDQAWKALSVILGRPFRSSVQALVLMAVALRLRSKDGVAWSMIGSAIRIGQSLGLHRYTVGPEASLDARIWYATMSLDAIGSIESGRPMTIRRSDYSASLTSFKDDTFTLGTTAQPVNVLAALAELCQEIAYIVQVLFPTNPATSSEYEIEVLEHIGLIHMRLETWAKSLPLQIRPGADTPVPGPFFPFATMLHMQYHQISNTLQTPLLDLSFDRHSHFRPESLYMQAPDDVASTSGCRGFLAQGLSPQFVDMYAAVNQMTRKKVMESFEPESLAPNAEEVSQPPEPEPTVDHTAVSIDELWSTLFGLSNTMESDVPQIRNDPPYRF